MDKEAVEKVMFYSVKDTQFKVGTGKGEYPSGLKALKAAIEYAVEWAQTEPVDVLKIDGGKVTVAYAVDKQPIRKQRQGNYWKETNNG